MTQPQFIRTNTHSEQHVRASKREQFLDEMERAVDWQEFTALAAFSDLQQEDGRAPVDLGILLRIYFMQRWFHLSDADAEEALYDVPVMRRFAGVDLEAAAAPAQAAIRNFRIRLEGGKLGGVLLAAVKLALEDQALRASVQSPTTAHDAAGSRSAGEHFPLMQQAAGSDQRKSHVARTPQNSRPEALYQGATALSVAVISPDIRRREAALKAVGDCQNGPIREYISYPPNLDDVPKTLGRDFDVILVDMDSDPEYALNLVKSITTTGLATVMVYSARAEQDVLLSSMRAGAREFLTLPFASEAMREALVRASAIRVADRFIKKSNGRLLIFLGAKGGTGVTTLACNFAASLAEDSGKKTLLIDLNLPLGDAAINLGLKPQYSIVSAFQNSERLDANLLSSLLEQHSSGLSVLAAPGELAATFVSAEAIDKLFEVACQSFDFVVVDAGSRLDLHREHLFDDSTTIYLVTQVGIPELRNSHRLISMLSAAASPKLELVLNRYDPRSMEIDEEHVTKALTRPAQWKIPNSYAAVRKMQSTATPLTDLDSPISQAIRAMTRPVCGQPVAREKKKRFSLFR